MLGELPRLGSHTAIVEPGRGAVSYEALDQLVARVADKLRRLGVGPGDRVGLYARRSVDVVAAMLGVLRIGAAYVPVDPTAPVARNAGIHADCAARLTLVEEKHRSSYVTALEALEASTTVASLGQVGLGTGLSAWLSGPDVPLSPAARGPVEGLGVILYTSGSTGKPKGVSLSRENVASFVDWCCSVYHPTTADRVASHAQLHFDISIHDVFMTLGAGATLVIVPDEVGKHAALALELMATERITLWYSAPAILAQIAALDAIASKDLSALRALSFAGEVFPIAPLKSLKRQLPGPHYYNLYGPTETNVCTYHALPDSIEHLERPVPIGIACENYEVCIAGDDGRPVAKGTEGELWARGPAVMLGYFGRDDLTSERMVPVSDGGRAWYRTGDVVVEQADGQIVYVGRRDRMVKRRGYRVELGEIEVRLHEHPAIAEAAVVAVPGKDGLELHAHLATRDGKPLSILQLKTFCGERLPSYMVPDKVVYHPALPRTSTNKLDYQRMITG